MFQFDFVVDADPDISDLLNLKSNETTATQDANYKWQSKSETSTSAPFTEHNLDDLVRAHLFC
jgi:hypothetical protein